MLTRRDLEGYRTVLGFNLGQIEKDYLQHIVLSMISRGTGDELVFKGGTCLQKVFGLNRFSEDLDFTQHRTVDIDAISSNITRGLEAFGYPASVDVDKKKDSSGCRLKIQGPLYQGTEKSLCSLHVEISKREKVILEPEFKSLYPVYPDLPPYSVLTMRTEEILGEKMRALITRSRARDLYDIFFLLKKDTRIDWNIIEEKMKYYDIAIDIDGISEAVAGRASSWDREITRLTALTQDFEDIKKYVTEKITDSYASR